MLRRAIPLLIVTGASLAQADPPRGEVQPAAAIAGPESSRLQTLLSDVDAPVRSWKFVVLHHSATRAGDVAGIDEEHRQRLDASGRPWLGIAYHFVIGNGHGMADGEVQETFRWRRQLAGAHAGQQDYNELGLGVCLIGNFEEAGPTRAQLQSTRQLVSALKNRFRLQDDQILRHADLKATACPGKLFSMEEILPPAAGVPARRGMVQMTGDQP